MPLQQEQHPAMHNYQNHVTTNVRRYPMPSIDPAQIQMYPAPPQMYTAQNSSCYACLTVPVGMQNRFSRYIQTLIKIQCKTWKTYLTLIEGNTRVIMMTLS